jgi:hypothetical protein
MGSRAARLIPGAEECVNTAAQADGLRKWGPEAADCPKYEQRNGDARAWTRSARTRAAMRASPCVLALGIAQITCRTKEDEWG